MGRIRLRVREVRERAMGAGVYHARRAPGKAGCVPCSTTPIFTGFDAEQRMRNNRHNRNSGRFIRHPPWMMIPERFTVVGELACQFNLLLGEPALFIFPVWAGAIAQEHECVLRVRPDAS